MNRIASYAYAAWLLAAGAIEAMTYPPKVWAIYPAPDLKPGTRYKFAFINGRAQTLVAMKHGRFRPLLWRMVWDRVRRA